MRILAAAKKEQRSAVQRKLDAHITEVNGDREALARVIRLCITRPNHCGFYVDAADSGKYNLPTTRHTGKIMSQLWRIKQKLTVAQTFDQRKTLHFFQSLPNVTTGGNLTATIVSRLLSLPEMRGCTDLYLNIDGSGDNICYTFYYFLAHVLLCSGKTGIALKRIHLMRMKVGHTHCDLDATFGKLR